MEAGWSGPTKHVKPTAETTISLSQIQVKHGDGVGDGDGEDEDGKQHEIEINLKGFSGLWASVGRYR